ncbi:DUF2231 domain-containing protein [Sphingobium sp. SYK-6]|uniref:DUF2231 domain-containing protein n=1 Tax=Sphingobium sp. (strain NBRC 103272 / SYK-6) TaxID=627192 RepID=UPI00059BB069|nr:DUF2231 domain-containing protein [Sphingobium sp. SYK-6]
MTALHRRRETVLHPLHAILLSFPVAMFSGALLSDLAYLKTAEIQWSNFSAWLITGAMLGGTGALVWAALSFVLGKRRAPGRPRALGYLLILAAMWILGLINAFQHSRDGWSSVGGAGLALSILCTLLALLAAWIGFAGIRRKEVLA